MSRRQHQAGEAAPLPPAPIQVRPGSAYAAPAVCSILFLAVILVFGTTLLYDFVNYDDDVLVYDNPMVARGVTAKGLVWAFTTSGLNMWYPVTWISYMLDSQLYGLKPWGYHLTNVLLHAATSVILFLALRRMTGNLWASALVALLFAIHPLRAEAVAWVGERKTPLSGLFFVSTIAAYSAYARHPFSLVRYLLMAAIFALGLLAKPSLVTLPFVLLLLDYWPLGRAGSRERGAGGHHVPMVGEQESAGKNPSFSPLPDPLRGCPACSLLSLLVEKIPLLLLSAGCSVAAVLSQAGNVQSLQSVPVPARIANSLISYAVYLGQFVWPIKLAVFYPRPENLPAWQVAGAFLVLTTVSLAALMSWRKQPAVLVGWLWYLGTLVPMIGLVPIGSHARADRYTYLPQIGLCIALVWGAYWGLERLWGDWVSRRWLCGVAGALLLAGLMVCAWQQTSYWQNSERLWTHALACTSNNVVADLNLGVALADCGQVDEAIVHFRKALELMPDCADAHNGLAAALAARGQIDDAITHYRKALEIKPDYAQAHNNLAAALAGCQRIDEAVAQFQKALEIKPYYAEAHYNLGLALAGRGQIDEAIGHYRKALQIKPDYAQAHYSLGNALIGCGQVEEAMVQYRKALEIRPDYAEAHSSLGVALAGCGRLDEAVAHYRKALEINPDDVEAHYNLGTALIGRGQVDEAILHYRKVLKIKPDDVGALNNIAWLRATHSDPKFRDGAEAVRLARRAAELTPNDPNTLSTLAAAYAEAMRFTEAVQTARKALDLATRQNNPALVKSIQVRMRLYETGKPFHETPSPPAETSLQP